MPAHSGENFLQEVVLYQQTKQGQNEFRGQCCLKATILMRTSSPELDSFPSEDSLLLKASVYIPKPTPKFHL